MAQLCLLFACLCLSGSVGLAQAMVMREGALVVGADLSAVRGRATRVGVEAGEYSLQGGCRTDKLGYGVSAVLGDHVSGRCSLYLEVLHSDRQEEASVGQLYATELEVLDQVETVSGEVAGSRLGGWDSLDDAGQVARVYSRGVHPYGDDLTGALHQELRRL